MNSSPDVSSKLGDARPWFESWRSPLEFEHRYREVRSAVTPNFQFNRHEAKWLLEAWLLSKFGRLKEASKIKLNRSDPPDGFVLIGDTELPIEMTEIIEPGRIRGREYQSVTPDIEYDPGENWVASANKIPMALQKQIQKKQQKQYSPRTELLVYLNINEFGIRQKEIEAAINSTLSKSTKPFSKIHVMWKEKLFDSDGCVIKDPSAFLDEDTDDDEEIFQSVWEREDRI